MIPDNVLVVLDTNVLVELMRNKDKGKHIQKKYDLLNRKEKPLICVVTIGELMSLARYNEWGESKKETLRTLLKELVVVDISDTAVIDMYSEIDFLSRKHPPGAIKMGKNDLWIASVAAVAGAALLTSDGDFDHLNDVVFKVYKP